MKLKKTQNCNINFHFRYLMSTGGDSNVCFWPWFPETGEFRYFKGQINFTLLKTF